MRELYDLIDDVTNRLSRSFGIVANSGKMKWIKPEEKAMACKVQFKKGGQVGVTQLYSRLQVDHYNRWC